MTIHLVYTLGDQRTTPQTITSHVADDLRQSYSVRTYDWLSPETIRPEPGDILLGHPAPPMGTIYRNSIDDERWAKRIIMSPFAFGMPEMIAFLDPLVARADHYLAITGPYWMRSLPGSIVEHWQYKMIHVDLAVDLNDFPFIKETFNPPGQRRFLYIGRNAPGKGTDYFAQLACVNRPMQFGTVGEPLGYRKIISHGRQYTASADFHSIARQYDFLLTCGNSDANPTTVLEAAAWGLIPICTPQCGYEQTSWLFNIPPNNVSLASQTLHHLQNLPAEALHEIQQRAREALQTHYNWQRFNAQVRACIEAPIPQRPVDAGWQAMATRNAARLRSIESRRILEARAMRLLRMPDQSLRRYIKRLIERRSVSPNA